MAERPRDVSFETLAQVTGVDITQLTKDGRGRLNAALGQIREAVPELEDIELALLIEGKARAYKKVMGRAILTPTALAANWGQLDALLAEHEKPVTYVTNDGLYCSTCNGVKSVLKYYRPVGPPGIWALEHRSKKNPHLGEPHPAHRGPEDGFEEWLPCPDCNASALAIVLEDQERFKRVHGRTPAPPAPEDLAAMRAVVGGTA